MHMGNEQVAVAGGAGVAVGTPALLRSVFIQGRQLYPPLCLWAGQRVMVKVFYLNRGFILLSSWWKLFVS